MFERPEYVVRGARSYDQQWIDESVEAGVGACGWARPKPRPATMDAAPAAKPVPVPKKRPTFVQRIKARVTGSAPIEPVPYIGQPVAPAEPTPAPRHVDPLDDLLGPS